MTRGIVTEKLMGAAVNGPANSFVITEADVWTLLALGALAGLILAALALLLTDVVRRVRAGSEARQ